MESEGNRFDRVMALADRRLAGGADIEGLRRRQGRQRWERQVDEPVAGEGGDREVELSWHDGSGGLTVW